MSWPFAEPYMQRAGALLIFLAIMGAVVGVHVVIRKLAFTVETLQHSVFPGIAAAYVTGNSLLLGAAAAAMLTVLSFSIVRRKSQLDSDAVLAVLITVFLAAGVIIVSRGGSYQHDLSVLLFGRMLAVDSQQLFETAVLALLVVLTLVFLHKELLLRAFDRSGAAALGYRVAVLDVILNVCVAVAVIAAVRSVGTVLLVAFIVTPAAAARLVTKRVNAMVLVATLITVTGGFVGLTASYLLSVDRGVDVPAGAATVVFITLIFCLVSAWRLLRSRRAMPV